jgi:hypothetical protein
MSDSNEVKNDWKKIIEILVKVGKANENDRIDYFSSIVPRHVQSYGAMMGKNYDVSNATRDELRTDWDESKVVDVIDRIVNLEDELHRRGVRILVHFLDFSTIHAAERGADREDRMIRFDINRLMRDLRDLKKSGDADAYGKALEDLRALEETAHQVDLSE